MNKELEALERIKQSYFTAMSFLGVEDKETKQAINIIETTLKRLEFYDKCNYQTTIHKDVLQISKELKAFEIIKEKPIVALVDYKYTYEEWLELVDEKDKDLFKNEEEYNLLKEVLL